MSLWSKINQLQFFDLFKIFISADQGQVKVNGSSADYSITHFGFVIFLYPIAISLISLFSGMIFTDRRYLFTAYSSVGVIKSKPNTSISEITEM